MEQRACDLCTKHAARRPGVGEDVKYRTRLIVWTIFIGVCVVPWMDLQNHTHWSKVQWIPFVTPPVKLIRWAGRKRSLLAVVAAAALSLATEWTQLYSHSRFPSLTDVTCNVIGAIVGVWIAQQFT
jgi:VanZ like family